MAASVAKRDLMYFTFHDAILMGELRTIYEAIKDKTVKTVYVMLEEYEADECSILEYFTAK